MKMKTTFIWGGDVVDHMPMAKGKTRGRQGWLLPLLVLLLVGLLAAACSTGGGSTAQDDEGDPDPVTDPVPVRLTVYSGRNEALIGPLLEQFAAETGITVDVRYGSTGEVAATILEEGANSPADVFIAQDAGALGALAREGLLRTLPGELLDKVDSRFRSPDGLWVGLSGRARVVAYNTDNVDPADLPEGIWAFTEPQWKGRLGWVPTNASFQSFVTALRLVEGEEGARRWLEGILANAPKDYANNVAALEAVGRGEVDAAFINHYYLYRLKAEMGDELAADNYYLTGGDAGALINVAGVGILAGSVSQEAAEALVEFLLSPTAQEYFARETYEYPLADGVQPAVDLPGLDEIGAPELDLSDLADLDRTIELLTEVGVL